jgi:transcription elongation factor Elf1
LYIIKQDVIYCVNAKIKRRNELRKQFQEYKQNLSCEHCGWNDHRALEFHHHNDDKKESISRLVAHGYSWETIKKEINKCQVLCANCHRLLHFKKIAVQI